VGNKIKRNSMKKIILFFIVIISSVCTSYSQPSSPLLENPPKETDVVTLPVTLNWNDVSGATCYCIEVVTDTTLVTSNKVCNSSTSQLTVSASDLDANTKYYWRVTARDNNGWSFPSPFFSFTTAATTAEGSIQNLTDGVIDLIADEDISPNQGNIIINRLEGVQNRLENNQPFVALVQMYIVKARIIVLRVSGQISNDVYQSLNYSTDGVIDLIDDEIQGRPNVSAYNNIVSPKSYSLLQNYPNPFNPVTTIEYALPENSFVSIKVYDMLGKEVTTLLSKQQDAGTYVVEWNASQYSSGIYFYRINAGNFTETKKMILSK
jgi:hypothetical protein